MAWTLHLQKLTARFTAALDNLAVGPGWLRNFPTAGLLAGCVALVMAAGLAAAGISVALNASPLPLVNTAAFVFLLASTVVSSHIVYAFWHHLLGDLGPKETKTMLAHRQRPARPLRDI